MLGALDVALEDLHHEVGIGDIVFHLVADDIALVVDVEDLLLHHSLAHGGHLWAMLGVDDGGYDVASEGGEHLQQDVVIVLARRLVGVVAYGQGGAVGGEASV